MDPLGYAIGTRVRLDRTFGVIPAGSEGIVIGYYRRESPSYAVAIAGEPVAIPPEYLEESDGEGG